MVIVGPKPVPYVAPPKPPTDEDDADDHPWLENGCLDSSWIKSTTSTDRKKKFEAFYHIMGWRGGKKSSSKSGSMSRGRSFNFQQLKDATHNFHHDNKIGEGGFGRVYRGVLPNGEVIAVNCWELFSNTKEGKKEFLKVVGTVSALNHPNLVKLLGCSTENNQLLLVYEYMENHSLSSALFGSGNLNLKSRLNWQTRFEICLGIAKGLAFLHEESYLKIIHTDIRPTNVLLDKDLNAKISDFGLAIHHEEEEETHVTKVGGGTSCYVAPEYAMRGLLTYKADVYSFGVVMLEILSGKASTDYMPNDDETAAFLLDLAYVLYQQGNLLELMDPDLKMDYNKVNQANRMLNLAMLCINPAPSVRPKMSEVVSILEGKTKLKSSVPFPAHYFDDGFGKASASAEKSVALHKTSCSIYDITDANHEKGPLAGDGHADIQEFDFEDAASTMQLHDHLSLMDEEEEKEEDNIAGVLLHDFDDGSSSSKVNNDQSTGDQTIGGGQKNDAKLLMERNFPVMAGPSESSNARKSWSSATLFTDHHVTKMNEEEDKRELEYVEPTFDEHGKLCIEYSEEEFEEGCNEWKDSMVGFFVGDDKPVIMNTILNKENVETLWGVKGDDAVCIFSMEDDYFLIRFKFVEDKIKVLESGPWHIENRPLILREWNWKLKFDKINEMKITLPIWVKMYNLPLFLWTSSYLSKVGSALGTPLCSDEETKNKERVDFARLCIQVDASKSLPNSLNISIKGVDYEIRFEYDWKPLRCAKMEDTKQN